MKAEIAWLEKLTDEQWSEIRTIARDLFDANYFAGNQMKIGIMAFLIWTQEDDSQRVSEMPNANLH